ncbi:CheW protein [Syntrophobacter sp. SbD1]|nr:CheW protein [Syntrophobacter sp. SbD1]
MRPSSPLSLGQRALEEATPLRQLVGFRIGDEEFGVDILMVQEIIRLPAITPIPNAPRFILGMINLRGRVIPIIDLRQRLLINGKNPGETDRTKRILILELDSHQTGFIVDSVSEVMKVPAAEIEPTPHLLALSIDARYIEGVIKLANRLLILLDFTQILRPQEQKELNEMGDIGAEFADKEPGPIPHSMSL